MQLAEQVQEKKNRPMLTGRQIAFTIYAFFKINDVQRKVIGTNDLLNIELVNDHVKKFDEAWQNILIGLKKEPEDYYLEGLHVRQWRKPTSMQNALPENHSDQIHRSEPTIYLKLNAIVTTKNTRHDTERGNSTKSSTKEEELMQTCTKQTSSRATLSNRGSEHFQAQTDHNIEGQDVPCRQWCFLAHDGKSSLSAGKKTIRQTKI